jgi:hypothetical protein
MDDDLYRKYVEWQDKNPPFIVQQYHCKNCGAPLHFYTNWTGSISDQYKECPSCHAAIEGWESVGTIY